MPRSVLLIVLVACGLVAGEATAPAAAAKDPKVLAKQVWADAAKAFDPWTCLQVEEWGREQKPVFKPSPVPVLGASCVIGSTLLALPEDIRLSADLGERVVYSTDYRVWVAAADGRPLQRSWPLPMSTWQQALGFGGKAIATAAKRGRELAVSTMRLDSGETRLSTATPIAPLRDNCHTLILSHDGGTAAVCIGPDEANLRRIVVITGNNAEKEHFPREHSWNPVAVGSGGRWLVFHRAEGELLACGDKVRPIRSPAPGPGLLAAFIGQVPTLILADGNDKPLVPGLPLGRDPRVDTVGEWLVLTSGDGAKVKSEGDILGTGAGEEVDQPCTMVLWRWADLAANSDAKPLTTVVGRFCPASDQAAALLVWSDKSIDQVDLSGTEPVRTHRQDAADVVTSVEVDRFDLRVGYADNRRSIYGPDGKEMWSGKVGDIWVKRNDLALSVRYGPGPKTYQLQFMSPDPAKRREVELPTELSDAGGVAIDFEREIGVGRRSGEWWQFGFDGKLKDHGDADGVPPRGAPRCEELDWPAGRFFRDGPRLFAKSATALPSDPMARLMSQDAWRVGPTTLILDRSGHVLANGRKRAEWNDLGEAPQADRFATFGPNVVLRDNVPDARPRIVATLTAGPALSTKAVDGAPEELPGGPWRVDWQNYAPPRGGQQRWDSDRSGIRNPRLRSPEASGMFVITRSAIIELDAEFGKEFGVAANPDPSGPGPGPRRRPR